MTERTRRSKPLLVPALALHVLSALLLTGVCTGCRGRWGIYEFRPGTARGDRFHKQVETIVNRIMKDPKGRQILSVIVMETTSELGPSNPADYLSMRAEMITTRLHGKLEKLAAPFSSLLLLGKKDPAGAQELTEDLQHYLMYVSRDYRWRIRSDKSLSRKMDLFKEYHGKTIWLRVRLAALELCRALVAAERIHHQRILPPSMPVPLPPQGPHHAPIPGGREPSSGPRELHH